MAKDTCSKCGASVVRTYATWKDIPGREFGWWNHSFYNWGDETRGNKSESVDTLVMDWHCPVCDNGAERSAVAEYLNKPYEKAYQAWKSGWALK